MTDHLESNPETERDAAEETVQIESAAAFLGSLNPAQKAAILERSDTLGSLQVAKSWTLIGVGLLLAALWPNPLTILLALIIVAGGQIGLAVLMHEAAHRSLFQTGWMNEKLGRYLCADPVFTSLEGYRKYHMQHHRLAGTEEDPDEYLTVRYPVSPASMRRKLLRDVSGMTGAKIYLFGLMAYAEYYKYQLNGIVEKHENHDRPLAYHLAAALKNMHGFLLSNLVLFALLWAIGYGWLYAIWWGALLTFFQVFLRVRQIGDHAVVPDRLDPNPARHTRTTDASWWERLLISPHNEHYHLEHHLVASAPSYRLPLVRKILEERGAIPAESHARSYLEVLRLAMTA